MPNVGVRLRVDIGAECSIGPGKIALLEQIEKSGSLSKAARELKMSYRRAWLLLEDLNRTLGQPVTTASIGGAGGGGAQITPFGRQLTAAFRAIESTATAAAAAHLDWLPQASTEPTPAHVAPRRAVTRPLAKARGGALIDSAATKPEVSAARPQKRARAAKRP